MTFNMSPLGIIFHPLAGTIQYRSKSVCQSWNGQLYLFHRYRQKGKVFPYSLPSVGPGADPGVMQSARRWREVNHAIYPAVGCRYFLPGLRLTP